MPSLSVIIVTWIVHCNKLQHIASLCNTLQHAGSHSKKPFWSILAVTWSTLQHTATHCTTLQHIAPHCNTLHHTATHCNTLQHAEPHSKNAILINAHRDIDSNLASSSLREACQNSQKSALQSIYKHEFSRHLTLENFYNPAAPTLQKAYQKFNSLLNLLHMERRRS